MTSPSPPSATEPSSAQAPPDVFAILAMFDALKLDRPVTTLTHQIAWTHSGRQAARALRRPAREPGIRLGPYAL